MRRSKSKWVKVLNIAILFLLMIGTSFRFVTPAWASVQWNPVGSSMSAWISGFEAYDGVLYAGNYGYYGGGGVYAFDSGSNTWSRLGNAHLSGNSGDWSHLNMDIHHVNGVMYSSTDGAGVYKYDSIGGTWTLAGQSTHLSGNTSDSSSKVFSLSEIDNVLYAGTASGAYQYDPDTNSWSIVGTSIHLSGDASDYSKSVWGFLKIDGLPYAGTADGVYTYNLTTNSWSLLGPSKHLSGNGSDGTNSVKQLSYIDNVLYAGTDYGVYKFDVQSQSWELVGNNPYLIGYNDNLEALHGGSSYIWKMQNYNGMLYASTRNGVFSYDEAQNDWKLVGGSTHLSGDPNDGAESSNMVGQLTAYNNVLYAGTNDFQVYSIIIPPSAPTTLTHDVPSATGWQEAWDAVNGADSYNIYVNNQFVANTTETTYSFTDMAPGTTYQVTISSENTAGSGAQSNPDEVTTAFVSPTGLSHSNVTDNGWEETWDLVNGASSYEVYLNGNQVGSVVDAVYNFTDLSPNTTYSVTVAEVTANGVGPQSSVDSITTLLAPVITSNPNNSTIDEGGDTSFTVVATGTGLTYQWQVDTGTGSFVNVSDGAPYSGATAVTLNITDVTASMDAYLYKVIVSGTVLPPATSTSATLTVNTAPEMPLVVGTVSGDAQVRLSWNPVSGSTGYRIFTSMTSGTYGAESFTVNESVYSTDVTGLTNGTTYYFVVIATNAGGDSAISNEVSATPVTVPEAPTEVTAVAGNGQATITFTVPSVNGGSAITGYEVSSNHGNITVTGITSPITITGLSNGTTYTFTVKTINSIGSSVASTVSNAVTPRLPSSNDDDPAPPKQIPNMGVDVLVNGKVENAGTAIVTKVNDQTVTTITVDQKKLEQKLTAEGQRAVITIPVNTKSDVVVGELNGQMVKNMEQKEAVVEIKTENATYTLPAQQININSISDQLGKNVALQDIKVQIEISTPATDTLRIVESSAIKGGFTIVAPPLNFTVRGIYGETSIDVSTFNAYVERTIAIPEGVDPNKITTGVVVDSDGTVRHVPTKIVIIDGEYYAKISSLTNSTYSVVWHPVEFKDVDMHWAKDAVNDMGSRMVVSGIGNVLYNPDQDITRAEFAAIIVRGLGLKLENGETPFSDVKASDWYSSAIHSAYSYHLISGYEDGTFRPMDKITREQAMTIIAKAMEITDLKAKLSFKEAGETLSSFADVNNVSEWAKKSIADCLQAGIVSGRNGKQLAPKNNISKAEVAAIVQRLLQKSELI